MDESKISEILAPVETAQVKKRERKVRSQFWSKFKSYAAHIPFGETIVAAYFCAIDSKTPVKVRGTLLAALAYFIMPIDAIPDIFAFVGFSDDIAVLTTAISLVQTHVTEEHQEQARDALEKMKEETA